MCCVLECLSSVCSQVVLALTLLSLVGFKVYMKSTAGICTSPKRMEGKTVIVTGANTGIGKETAHDLAQRGARVILACRDMVRGNKARDEIVTRTGNTSVFVRHMDLASLSSVRDFAAEIIASEDRVDVLINNAGAGGLPNQKTQDGLQLAMQVNYFGPFLLTNLLVDLMKKSAPSRIIFVSALAHRYPSKLDVDDLNFEKNFGTVLVYSSSKLSNILNSNELARKLDGTGVTVNSLHPGVIHTEFGRNMPRWTQAAGNWFMKNFCKTAEEGAQTTIYLAVSDEVQGVTGKYFSDCKEAKISALARDEGLAKKLWEKTEELVNMKRE